MKKVFLISLMAFALCTLHGQDLNYAKEVVSTLSSPGFCGRGFVEDGNKIAAQYIRDQFAQIGLKPLSKDFFQTFRVTVNTFPKAMKLFFDDIGLIPGKDYLIDPLSSSLKGEFSVFVINKSDLLNDEKTSAAIHSSTGKILVIDERNFEKVNKEDRERADELITFLKYNPQVQTAGTIIITSEKLSWENATEQASKTSFLVNYDYDLSKLHKVTIEVDASLQNFKTQNIIGYVEGKQEPDTFLVAIAHYDHLGKMGPDTYFPGANDNASGIAMLLTLAKHFKANPDNYSVAFIALSAEEIGIVGATQFTADPSFDLSRIKFLVNFDIAGTGDEGIKVVNGSVFQEKFDLLSGINAQNNYLASVQIRGAACNSDHCPFYNKKVPCFYIYTLGGIKAYHDIYDRAETLPLTEFIDYSKLMIDFFNRIK